MTTFIVVSLFKATSSAADAEPLWQETYAQVKAFDAASATQAVETHSAKRETSYTNKNGDTITWSFEGVVDVSEELEEIFTDGVKELYARHFRDVDAYRAMETLEG